MLEMCVAFAHEFSVTFNAQKSQFLYYPCGSTDYAPASIIFDGQSVEISDDAVHLGNTIGPQTTKESKAISKHVGELYGRVNVLMSQFGHCHPLTRLELFRSYCSSLYGIELVNVMDNANMERLFTAWRKCLRRILGINPRTHCDLLSYITNMPRLLGQVAEVSRCF